MTYEEVVTQLFNLLRLANDADHDDMALDWQRPHDASQYRFYGDIRQALIRIAGPKIVMWWDETNEINMSLADRL